MFYYWGWIFQAVKLGYPFPYVFALRVKLFGLERRTEHPEIRSGVSTRTGCPLPASIIGGQIVVEELPGKIGFAPAPVDEQVLGEETGRGSCAPGCA
jgi:hypothetical protein